MKLNTRLAQLRKQHTIVGPLTGTPRRAGLYLRQSSKTGDAVWSYFGGNNHKWHLYSDTKDGALEKYKHRKVSKYQDLPWYGVAK